MPTSALQVARTGLEAQDARMRVIANNLANVGTTGFKRDRANFATLAYQDARVAGQRSSGETAYAEGLNSRLEIRAATRPGSPAGGKIQIPQHIEMTEQADILTEMGCRYLQGYHFSPPVAFDVMLQRFARRQTSLSQNLS